LATVSENEFVRERHTSTVKSDNLINRLLRDIWQTMRDKRKLVLFINSKSYILAFDWYTQISDPE